MGERIESRASLLEARRKCRLSMIHVPLALLNFGYVKDASIVKISRAINPLMTWCFKIRRQIRDVAIALHTPDSQSKELPIKTRQIQSWSEYRILSLVPCEDAAAIFTISLLLVPAILLSLGAS